MHVTEQAVELLPAATAQAAPLMGLAPLLRAAYQDEDLSVHVPGLIERAERFNDAYAMLDLALILQLRFQKPNALAVLDEALKIQRLFHVQHAEPDAPRLLVIKTPGDLMANTPVECILEDAALNIDVLYVDAKLPWPTPLPAHDLVFVAISEADAHRATLAQLGEYLHDWPRPVLNLPQRIPALSRAEAFRVLHDVPGLCMARTYRVTRAALLALLVDPAQLMHVLPGVDLPLIVRPLGSHAGTDLCRVDTLDELADYLARVDAREFFVAQFIEYASPDGLYRKYRIVLIDGAPFICHMGISAHWMVHYPYDEMKPDPARRAEEAELMARFDQDFAQRHAAALVQLHQRVGLEYVGFDCAQTTDGQLLIFELANALVIHAMDDPGIFPYKAVQMQKVFGAFADMLHRHAAPRA
ncbi:MAG: hypothetical protein ABW154_06320 [Dyella sp.]